MDSVTGPGGRVQLSDAVPTLRLELPVSSAGLSLGHLLLETGCHVE